MQKKAANMQTLAKYPKMCKKNVKTKLETCANIAFKTKKIAQLRKKLAQTASVASTTFCITDYKYY